MLTRIFDAFCQFVRHLTRLDRLKQDTKFNIETSLAFKLNPAENDNAAHPKNKFKK